MSEDWIFLFSLLKELAAGRTHKISSYKYILCYRLEREGSFHSVVLRETVVE